MTNYNMLSLDVGSPFTNIPLNETIDICVNNVFRETNIINGLDKDNFRTLLTIAVTESYFMLMVLYTNRLMAWQ